MHLFPNPMLYWFGLAAVLILFGKFLMATRSFLFTRTADFTYFFMFFVVFGYFGNLLPWILVSRSTFLYHYQPSSGFAFLALAFFVSSLLDNNKGQNRLFASIIIGILSFLSFETSTGFWLMFSFGSSTLIVLVFHDSEFAQPANVFFGHLLGIVIGILFNEFLGMSYLTLGLSVGTTVTIMMYFKIIHPPAAANPLIALFADVSLNYIVFPVIVGSIVIIILSIIINRYLLKRNYPVRWF